MIDRVFTLLVVPLIIVLAVVGWGVVAGRLRRGELVLPFQPRRNPPWGLADLLLAMFGSIGFLVLFELALRGELPNSKAAEPDMISLLSGSLAYLAAMAASILVLRIRSRATWAELGLDLRFATADIRLGLTTFAMLAPVVFGIQLILVQWLKFEYDQPLITLVRESPDLGAAALAVFAAVIAAPLAEEYFFRLLLQGWLEKLVTARSSSNDLLLGRQSTSSASNDDTADMPINRLRLTGALVIAAGLFALAHSSQGWAPTIPLFVLALGMGFLYQRTHRLLPSIVTHFTLNAFSTALLLIESFQPPPT